uniref:Uncharacterized protein n=1 Tax=Micrurus lemniscatus lemniscatus TaxID=129467 RepID=A0A2D4HIR2_MICLE
MAHHFPSRPGVPQAPVHGPALVRGMPWKPGCANKQSPIHGMQANTCSSMATVEKPLVHGTGPWWPKGGVGAPFFTTTMSKNCIYKSSSHNYHTTPQSRGQNSGVWQPAHYYSNST